jgi:hypothetical protein
MVPVATTAAAVDAALAAAVATSPTVLARLFYTPIWFVAFPW